jgi:hypothetical protein
LEDPKEKFEEGEYIFLLTFGAIHLRIGGGSAQIRLIVSLWGGFTRMTWKEDLERSKASSRNEPMQVQAANGAILPNFFLSNLRSFAS